MYDDLHFASYKRRGFCLWRWTRTFRHCLRDAIGGSTGMKTCWCKVQCGLRVEDTGLVYIRHDLAHPCMIAKCRTQPSHLFAVLELRALESFLQPLEGRFPTHRTHRAHGPAQLSIQSRERTLIREARRVARFLGR